MLRVAVHVVMGKFSVTCRCACSDGKSSVLRAVVHVVLGRVQCYVSLCR